jgi:hypothetical protein
MGAILDKASLVITPNAVKASKLYSVVPNDGTGDLTVVRATTATRVNASGLIETSALNVPRLDYTNSSCPSILVEPQRTNLVFPSATATTQSRTVTATAHTLSFYGTGIVVLSGVAIATLSGTGANDRVTLTFTPTAGTLILTIVGSVINWQLEAGANATSYIPTTTATVTRNTDVFSLNDLQTKGILSNDWTIYHEFTDYYRSGNSAFVFFGLKNQTLTDTIYFIRNNGYVMGFGKKENNGSIIQTGSLIQIPIGSLVKLIIKCDNNNIKAYINGTLAYSTTFLNPQLMTNLRYGEIQLGNGDNIIYTKSILAFKTALTDAECIQLTTI